jgi:lipopolysaccharide transport system ATP-binding protein
MPNSIIIQNLYKEYRLGVIGHGTLYRDLQSYYAKIRGREDPNSIIGGQTNYNSQNSFLALKNINLEINSGTVLGIIGHNGAGKSTLLKILSRITSPTKGIIKLKGKVASLLEVGTGFHSELTGRENIYLNGSINGMRKFELDRKLDQIVDFAGIDKFLDTPIKRYSSGMIVRLGFAIAAFIDPDILIVDEVLAVGDAEFQKKAINKIKDVSLNQGRTVLFVSHNMESIKKLCDKSIILSKGCLVDQGDTHKMIDTYLNSAKSNSLNKSGIVEWKKELRPGNEVVKLNFISTEDKFGVTKSVFDVSDEIYLKFSFDVLKKDFQIASILEFTLLSNPDFALIKTLSEYVDKDWGKQEPFQKGNFLSRCKIPSNLFGESNLLVSLRIFSPPYAANLSEHVKALHVINFTVVDNLKKGTSRGTYPYELGVSLRPKFNWQTTKGL